MFRMIWKKRRFPVTAAYLVIILLGLSVAFMPGKTWADETGEKKLVITVVDETEYMEIEEEEVPLAVYSDQKPQLDFGVFLMPAATTVILCIWLLFIINRKRHLRLLRKKYADEDYRLAKQYRISGKN